METAQKEFEGLLSDPEIRRQLCKSLKCFGLLYFSCHLYLPPGQFHDELIGALENPDEEFVEIIGFRGSSNTTWGSLITPIFLALERGQEYPFIILATDTSVRMHLPWCMLCARRDGSCPPRELQFGAFSPFCVHGNTSRLRKRVLREGCCPRLNSPRPD